MSEQVSYREVSPATFFPNIHDRLKEIIPEEGFSPVPIFLAEMLRDSGGESVRVLFSRGGDIGAFPGNNKVKDLNDKVIPSANIVKEVVVAGQCEVSMIVARILHLDADQNKYIGWLPMVKAKRVGGKKSRAYYWLPLDERGELVGELDWYKWDDFSKFFNK